MYDVDNMRLDSTKRHLLKVIITYNNSESETVTGNVPKLQSFQSTTVTPKFITSEEVAMLQKMFNKQITLLGKELAPKENDCKRIHNRYIEAIEPSQEDVGNYY